MLGIVLCGRLAAAEVEVDVSSIPRISAPTGIAGKALPLENGGTRLEFNFSESKGDWIHYVYSIPAVDGPIRKIVVVARGTPVLIGAGVRGAGGELVVRKCGPLEEQNFQTFELDFPPAGSAKSDSAITKVYITLKGRSFPQGFIEVSKFVLTTD